MKKKISIIVPVYNAEKYLGRCVDSILSQTYQNIELILIDDGSCDSSGKIMKEYALRDSRIKIISQANQGPGAARNVGLDVASGEYITFVDSDDFIEPVTYEHMLKCMTEYNADITVCNYRDREDNSKLAKEEITVLNQEEALNERLVTCAISDSLCDKVYRTELWQQIRLPTDRMLSEDTAVIYKIIAQAKRVIGLNKPYYKLYRREGSLSHRAYSPKFVYTIATYEEMVDFFKKRETPKFKKIAEQKVIGAIFFNTKEYVLSGCKDKETKKLLKKKAKCAIKKYKAISKKDKIKLFAVAHLFFALKLILK